MKERLAERVARRIVEHIKLHSLPTGHHLGARELADRFKVSRAPVNAALKLLSQDDLVNLEPNRGYFVKKPADELPPVKAEPADQEDRLYFVIAEDWLSGRLPARISENELMRLYGVARIRLQVLLAQIADEGWVIRLPGHGWEFQPIVSSTASYEQAYQFRAAVETAAVGQAGFAVNQEELERARAEQQSLLDGQMLTLPRDRLFAINSSFHEMIVSWSNNSFFVDAIRRVNRLRRLIEYRAAVDRSRLDRQCREHLAILDMLENGHHGAAAEFLRSHIAHAWTVKKDDASVGEAPMA